MKTKAIGYVKGSQRRIVIGFDDDTFADVKRYAEKHKLSFGRAAWLLIVTGIQTKTDAT